MFLSSLYVSLGGAFGALTRHLTNQAVIRLMGANYPFGTIVVNLSGAFIIGILWGYFERHGMQLLKLMMITGFLGGFTTFSTFAMDGLQLFKQGLISQALFYVGFSNLAALLLVYIGHTISIQLWN